MLGIFLDTETNGLNPFVHRAVEIAFKILDLTSGEVVAIYDSVIKQSPADWERSDPASLAVNGFTYEMVREGVPTSKVAEEITNLLQKTGVHRENAVFICQNPSFDRIFFSQLISPELQEQFKWPYYWLDFASMYWATALHEGKLPWKTGFSKNKIATTYNLPPEQSPHRAINGVDHLLLCYEKVIGFK